MDNCRLFPVIDLEKTGRNIARLRRAAGLSVRDVQQYLGLEYPQAIYKWQQGQCLPTVDHLLALAHLFSAPMETILVFHCLQVENGEEKLNAAA